MRSPSGYVIVQWNKYICEQKDIRINQLIQWLPGPTFISYTSYQSNVTTRNDCHKNVNMPDNEIADSNLLKTNDIPPKL